MQGAPQLCPVLLIEGLFSVTFRTLSDNIRRARLSCSGWIKKISAFVAQIISQYALTIFDRTVEVLLASGALMSTSGFYYLQKTDQIPPGDFVERRYGAMFDYTYRYSDHRF